jgi:hypothetical protein
MYFTASRIKRAPFSEVFNVAHIQEVRKFINRFDDFQRINQASILITIKGKDEECCWTFYHKLTALPIDVRNLGKAILEIKGARE